MSNITLLLKNRFYEREIHCCDMLLSVCVLRSAVRLWWLLLLSVCTAYSIVHGACHRRSRRRREDGGPRWRHRGRLLHAVRQALPQQVDAHRPPAHRPRHLQPQARPELHLHRVREGVRQQGEAQVAHLPARWWVHRRQPAAVRSAVSVAGTTIGDSRRSIETTFNQAFDHAWL